MTSTFSNVRQSLLRPSATALRELALTNSAVPEAANPSPLFIQQANDLRRQHDQLSWILLFGGLLAEFHPFLTDLSPRSTLLKSESPPLFRRNTFTK